MNYVVQQVIQNFKENQKEIQELDEKMLLLDKKQGYLEKTDIAKWITLHFSMWGVYHLMQSRQLIIPNNSKSFIELYKNESDFKVLVNYLKKHNFSKEIFLIVFKNLFQELAVSGMLERITIQDKEEGWLIKNLEQWNTIYKKMWNLAH